MASGVALPAGSFLPSTAVLEMTYRCNHGCLFCSCPWEVEGNGFDRETELATAEWMAILDDLAARDVLNFAFTGGEALLREDLWQLVEHASGLRVNNWVTKDGELVCETAAPKLYLLSNGWKVTDEVLDLCLRYGVQLSLSLPGLRTFERHTLVDNARGVLQLFRRARDKGLPTVVNVTVTRWNLHELYETIAEAFLAGASRLLMNRFLPGGRGLAHATELELSRDQVREMCRVADEVLVAANRDGDAGTELPACALEGLDLKRLQVSTRCSAGIGFFVIDPSGYVRGCNHSPERLLPYARVDDLRSHPTWKRYTQRQYLPDACMDCGQSGSCDGGCREAARIVGGSLDSLDSIATPPRRTA